MKFTKIPTTTFQQLGMNAGVLLSEFTPATPTLSDEKILGATSGGINVSIVPSYEDFGDDIDNCPKNSKELKKCTGYEVKASGTFITVNPSLAARLLSTGVVDSTDETKITPRADLDDSDFADLWFVGDYSDKNGATNGGYIAIKLINALSTGGFSLQSSDKGKMQFSFEFTAHMSLSTQDTVPVEIYIKSGTAEAS